jgi:prepilin-type N-terminal cleavage/methylation domain-containing protein
MGRHSAATHRAARGGAVVLKCRGITLPELLVAMTLAAVLLGAAGSTLLRQRRQGDLASARSSAESQLRVALAAIPAALQGLAPSAGDFAPGEARDTALQIRAVVAYGIACDSAAGAGIFSVADTGVERESVLIAAPHVGDTLWWLPPGGDVWVARRVSAITTGTGMCAREGTSTRALLRLGFSAGDTIPRSAPIRLTRSTRYSFYHAGDGSWQLGIAEWSDVLHDFAAPQPVAGPFRLASPSGTRTGFRYYDVAGSELTGTGQGAPVASIARLRVTLLAQEGASSSMPLVRADSLDIAFGHAP